MTREAPAVVALTGGIASGKTAVSDRFAARGVPVIDTDLIAREVVAPGQPLLRRIAARFGADILDADGTLNRRALRDIVFADQGARHDLEALLHPAILAETRRRLEALDAPWAVVVIPLLAEIGRRDWIDRVLVVDSPVEDQLDRLQRRDGVDRTQAEATLAAQAKRSQRLEIADDVIRNDGTLDDLLQKADRQVEAYRKRYGA
jgi:dephospho-CoA kinase